MSIRFRFNVRKAVEVILWFSEIRPGITLHTLLKLLFYADKYHLNRYGRPIVGDDYRALQYGPVASTTYDILKGDNLGLELLGDERPFDVAGGRHVRGRRRPDLDVLSESDVEALAWSFKKYGRLNFGQLTELTHKEPAWVNAEGRLMRYEDFLDDTDDKAERVEDIRDAALRMVI
jgi:uncharacterized phage-associated protein